MGETVDAPVPLTTAPSSVAEHFFGEPAPEAAVYTSTGYNVSANTTYWLELDRGGRTIAVWISRTSSNSEDSAGKIGWSIGNGHRYRSDDTADWTSAATATRMRIEGRAKAATVPAAPLNLMAEESGT